MGFPVGVDLFVYTEEAFAWLAKDFPGWYETIRGGRELGGGPMSRTALELRPEDPQSYHPGGRGDEPAAATRWPQAWQVARAAADLLRREFCATRVVAFGSLAHRAWFTSRSDIDLAAWGIPLASFYRAVAAVTGLSAEFEIDLVSPDDVRPGVRRAIEQEGVDL